MIELQGNNLLILSFLSFARTIAPIGRAMLAALVAMLTACTTQMTAPAQTPALALSSGEAALYVFRPVGLAGSGGTYNIVIDGRPYGSLSNGQFFQDALPAGPHVIRVSDFTSSANRFKAEPGKTYAFVVSYQPLNMLAPYRIEAVSEDEARKYAQQLTFNSQHGSVRQSEARQVAVESMSCEQLRAAISDAKATTAKANAQRGGNPVGGYVAGILIPGAIGNDILASQYVGNEVFEAAKAREDKLNAIYQNKKC